MSWSTCYKGSNNIYSDFPAMMSDGRVYTEHDTSCEINNGILKNAGISNNYDYRQYLIHNGLDIMSQNTSSSQVNSNVMSLLIILQQINICLKVCQIPHSHLDMKLLILKICI